MYTRTAGHTRPDGEFLDVFSNQRIRSPIPIDQHSPILFDRIPQIEDQFLRVQRGFCRVSWASILTATTFGTGIAVKQLFPCHIAERVDEDWLTAVRRFCYWFELSSRSIDL